MTYPEPDPADLMLALSLVGVVMIITMIFVGAVYL